MLCVLIYRAGATFDKALDAADRVAGRKILAPLHFLWAKSGFPAQTGDPTGTLAGHGAMILLTKVAKAGHFVMEENPQSVLDAFISAFLKPLTICHELTHSSPNPC